MANLLSKSELLVKYGFIKNDYKQFYELNKKTNYYVPKAVAPGKTPSVTTYDPSHAAEEKDEEVNLALNKMYQATGFPKPGKRYRLVYEAFNMALEELYFWSINHVRQDAGFPKLIKINDVFSASENSAFFGQSAQRLSIQEDRASSFLRGISELIKTLFQIVRELRIIDERLEIYNSWKKSKSADATLKGIFADFAENKSGQMQPGSIYHLSNQVGYAVLPDLFFNTVVYKTEDVDKVVDGLSFNKNVKAVLKRKIYQFIVWKEKTELELLARRKFQIKYLRQHYLTIKTYMIWVKPYLKHIKRLTMNEEQLDSPDLVSSFETSATEIEVLAVKPIPGNACRACILMTFEFKTRPVMQYRQEYSQGPVHVGRGTMTLRGYGWTDDEIKMYKKMRDDEDLELMGLVDDQLKSAMEMLGKDLEQYIKEAEDSLEPSKEVVGGAPKGQKMKKMQSDGSVFDPFVDLFKGFWEIGGVMVPKGIMGSSKDKGGEKKDAGKAISTAKTGMWMVYNNYKKAHGLLSW